MKLLTIALFSLLSTVAFAETEKCTAEHFQILEKAQGPGSENLSSIMMHESPNFSCEVTSKYYAFPADCGRFTYIGYEYNITVAANTIKAVVRDGSISCVGTKKTVLVKAEISTDL